MEIYNYSGDGRIRIFQEVLEVGGEQFVVSNLEICGITMGDEGIYSCSAYLPSGVNVTSGDFRVNVSSAVRESTIYLPHS